MTVLSVGPVETASEKASAANNAGRVGANLLKLRQSQPPAMYIAVALCLPRQSSNECSFNLSTLPSQWFQLVDQSKLDKPGFQQLCLFYPFVNGPYILETFRTQKISRAVYTP